MPPQISPFYFLAFPLLPPDLFGVVLGQLPPGPGWLEGGRLEFEFCALSIYFNMVIPLFTGLYWATICQLKQ